MKRFRIYIERKAIEALPPIIVEAETAAEAMDKALAERVKDENDIGWETITVDPPYVQAIDVQE